MRTHVTLVALGILVVMVTVTVQAALAISLWDAWEDYSGNPWAIATLVDAYSGFLLFFLYVAWRERSPLARAAWFAAIMALGNMATATYVLLQLRQLRPGDPAWVILGAKASTPTPGRERNRARGSSS